MSTPAASHLAVARIEAGGGARTVVTALQATPPLRLLPIRGGHAAWVYQTGLGGGFVGTDDIALDIEVEPHATLLLTTQASSKVYRAARARQTVTARVADGATLVAWPDPVACFAGSRFDQMQRFELAATASVLVVDAWTAGRVARGERWHMERITSRLSILVERGMVERGTIERGATGDPPHSNRTVLDDAIVLDARHGSIAARLGDIDAFATIAITGPRFDAGALVDRIADQPIAATGVRSSASRWPWGAVIRVAAPDSEALASGIRTLIGAQVTVALGADPWARRS